MCEPGQAAKHKQSARSSTHSKATRQPKNIGAHAPRFASDDPVGRRI